MSNRDSGDGNFYKCATGKTVEFVGLSPFEIDEVKSLVRLPQAPTREVETAIAGYVEVEELAADDLRDDEEKKRWTAYAAELQAAKSKRDNLVMEFILTEGIRFEMSDLEAWKSRRQRWNLPIPEDEREMAVAYVKTAVIGSAADMNKIIEGVLNRQGVSEEVLKAVQETFQRAARRDSAVEVEPAAVEVDVQPEVSGDAGGERLGDRAAH